MNNVRNDKFKCLLCLFSDSTIVTSCGCLFCDNCYQETKSYINKEKARCISCNKNINYDLSIDIRNKKEICAQIANHKEHYKLIVDMINYLKLYNESFIVKLKKIVDEKKNEPLQCFDMNANNENKINYKGIYESAKEKYNLFRTNRYMSDYLYSDKHKSELSKSKSRSKSRKRRYVDIENNPITETSQHFTKRYKLY